MDAAWWSSTFLVVVSFNCALALNWGKTTIAPKKDQPSRIPQDGVWQPVSHTKNEFYVYSAFVEARETVVGVRVIAITNTFRPHDGVFCRVWMPDGQVLTLRARVKVASENWRLAFSAAYVLCELDLGVEPRELHGASLAVIASMAANKPHTNLLNVIYPLPDSEADLKSLHVCVKPFHFSYRRMLWMIEWIELNRLLGVSHFYMYNDDMSDQMDCLLRHYEKKGLITLLPWNIPITVSDDRLIRIRGQYAAFNDCLYRSMATAGWLLITDTDEVVIPRNEDDLITLLDSLLETYSKDHPKIVSFIFRNVFFYLNLQDDPESPTLLLTSRKTRRMMRPTPLPNRSKYVVRPLEVIEPGNHYIYTTTEGASSVNVSVERAMLHHYREKCVDTEPCPLELQKRNVTDGTIVDRTAHRWSNKLWKRVISTLKRIPCLQSYRNCTEKFQSEEVHQASPVPKGQDAVWQPVAHTKNEFYVYSAFVETRRLVGVRVIAITITIRPHDDVFCRVWMSHGRVLTLTAKVKVIKDHWGLKYTAAYVLCDLKGTGVEPHETEGASLAVVASTAADKPPTNFLNVINSFPDSKDYLKSLHVCVKPFHFSYRRVDWMIEWIELNRLLGVSHFYMYNDSMSDQMDCLLRHYERKGLITLLPWNIPTPVSDDNLIRIRGQFAALSDCLYRSMATAGWLMIIDADEVVIPRREYTLTSLLDSLNKTYNNHQPRVGGFIVQNVFFYLSFQDDPESPVSLLTIRKTRRMMRPTPLPSRTKYIVRPPDVIEPGNHFIHKTAPGAVTVNIPVEQALLHHYREKCADNDPCALELQTENVTDGTIVDRTAHRWSNKLLKRVISKLKKIPCLQSCQNCTEEEEASNEVPQASPVLNGQDGVWQPVAHTKNEFYVYSAFVETRRLVGVRVIAITNTIRPHDDVFCRIWMSLGRILTLTAKVKVISENGNLKYTAAYVLCKLNGTGVKPHETGGALLSVVASTAADKPPSNVLNVINSFPDSKVYLKSLHVCVKPFHFSYRRVDWMIEWIELNRLLGVSHFYMYNDSMSDQMDCLLRHYERKGLITLLPWNIPITVSDDKLIRIRGQYAAFNDCLYRSMATAGWLMIIDADEVMIPRREYTLTSLLDSLNKTYNNHQPRVGGIIVQNVFFYLSFQDDPESPVSLVTSRKTRRIMKPCTSRFRSKYIVRPPDVIEPGNHFIYTTAPGAVTVNIPVEQVLLHHYREKCAGSEPCPLDNGEERRNITELTTVDRTAHRWSKQLWKRVQLKLKNIRCLLRVTERTRRRRRRRGRGPKCQTTFHGNSCDAKT